MQKKIETLCREIFKVMGITVPTNFNNAIVAMKEQGHYSDYDAIIIMLQKTRHDVMGIRRVV